MEDKLKEYGLHLRELDSPERLPIDFYIEDDEDNICWVWGADAGSVDIECNHPTECIEYGDDDEQGECKLCGAKCDWHWVHDVVDDGYDADGEYYAKEGEVREITDWYYPKKVGGIVGRYLKQLQEKR